MVLLEDVFNMGPSNPSEKRDYTFRMWVSKDIPASEMATPKTYRVKIGVYGKQIIKEPAPLAAAYIESLLPSNPTTMANDDPDGNVRYMGKTAANYVTFNGEEAGWRIIGVFDVDNGTGKIEKRIKLMRNETLKANSTAFDTTLLWSSSAPDINQGYGVNEWSQSELEKLLNDGAYYNRTTGTCYTNAYSGPQTETCDFTATGLTTEAKNLIDNAVWHTGTLDGETNTTSTSNAIAFYNAERSAVNGKGCTEIQNMCNDTVERTTSWTGKVGLMYPSDYAYTTAGGTTTNRNACLNTALYSWGSKIRDCSNNSWFPSNPTLWTMTPKRADVNFNDAGSDVFYVDPSYYGRAYYQNAILGGRVHPVVYLASNVKITDGDGTNTNPYQLGL